MKTTQIVSALHNAATPKAKLAAWQNRHIANRRRLIADYYAKASSGAERRRALIDSTGPELSSPDATTPLLWVDEKSPEILASYAGSKTGGGRDLYTWYTGDFHDETLETYAVILARFPRLVFYAVKDSCSDGLRVDLAEWEEIDFAECESGYQADDARSDAAREIIRSNDSTTQRQAEEEQEFQRKDRIERDVAENKETLATLRHEIRALAHELKTLCHSALATDYPSALATDYPTAGKAVLSSLRQLLGERRELMETNARLLASA